jgi:hypothetical protein
MRATLRIRMALVPFRMNTYFFDDLCSKLTDDLPRLMNVIETSVRKIKAFLQIDDSSDYSLLVA